MSDMTTALRTLLAAASAILLALPLPAAARQDAAVPNNWVLTHVREPNTSGVIATAPFDNGITVVARCLNNMFDLALVGLPAVDGAQTTRQLILITGEDSAERTSSWAVASDHTAAFSRLPAVIARRLAKGGPLQIIVPGRPGERRTRYVMSLTRSESALQETLTRCGRPLVDPRDDQLYGDGEGMPGGIVWVRGPRPELPGATVHGVSNGGSVSLSCAVTAGGRLEDCEIESEYPPGSLLGLAVRRSLEPARVGLTDAAIAEGQTLESRRIAFTVTFRIQ
jgi:hypothetical protein